jgi:hypothetical protein
MVTKTLELSRAAAVANKIELALLDASSSDEEYDMLEEVVGLSLVLGRVLREIGEQIPYPGLDIAKTFANDTLKKVMAGEYVPESFDLADGNKQENPS